MEYFLLLLPVGLLAGILAGLLGIGGGLVTVPFLYALFHSQGWPPDEVMHIAIGTSLASTVVTTFVSTWAHHRRKAVDSHILRLYIGGLLLGCITGAYIAQHLSGGILRLIFGAISALLGLSFIVPYIPRITIARGPNRSLNLFGFLIGILSSLLGIGGGIFSVPILLAYQVPMTKAVAASSASTFASVWLGSITYLVIAWHSPAHPYTFGYIELPAFFALSVGSVLITPLAVKWAHLVPTALLKVLFGVVLCLTGATMIFF